MMDFNSTNRLSVLENDKHLIDELKIDGEEITTQFASKKLILSRLREEFQPIIVITAFLTISLALLVIIPLNFLPSAIPKFYINYRVDLKFTLLAIFAGFAITFTTYIFIFINIQLRSLERKIKEIEHRSLTEIKSISTFFKNFDE
ncbi:hypothetical protein D4R71_04250 [bacterium]|nr:MAG: hypothetical protein D4R71_04250 [bacterium]